MKLAPLLSQFLLQHKRLDLPGIGIITLEGGAYPDPDSKTGKMIGGDLQFESKPSVRESPELVQFIAAETGKQKALASSDLESYLELAQQFLNIGKPFLLEGIGSLTKNRDGSYAFTAGQFITEQLKEKHIKESSLEQETHPDYKSILYNSRNKSNLKKPVVILLVLAGLAFAVWGGYTIYRKSSDKKEVVQPVADTQTQNQPQIQQPVNDTATQMVLDTTQHTSVKPDTVLAPVQPAVSTPVGSGTYKYIFEVSPLTRAVARFALLKKFGWPIQMETKDSVKYTLFVRLAGEARDTAHLVDSFSRFNGKRVRIEN